MLVCLWEFFGGDHVVRRQQLVQSVVVVSGVGVLVEAGVVRLAALSITIGGWRARGDN